MGAETGLLDEIRKTEEMCKEKVEQAKKDAQKIVSDALEEATRIIQRYEKDSEESTAAYFKNEQRSLEGEVQKIRAKADTEIVSVRNHGIECTSRAVEKITSIVTHT